MESPSHPHYHPRQCLGSGESHPQITSSFSRLLPTANCFLACNIKAVFSSKHIKTQIKKKQNLHFVFTCFAHPLMLDLDSLKRLFHGVINHIFLLNWRETLSGSADHPRSAQTSAPPEKVSGHLYSCWLASSSVSTAVRTHCDARDPELAAHSGDGETLLFQLVACRCTLGF